MRAVLKYKKDQFANILDGERDNDLQRNLTVAIRAGVEACLRNTLQSEWLKSVRSGREELGIWEGGIGHPDFFLANLHQKEGFFASDFRLQVDVPKNTTSLIESIDSSEGVDYSSEMSRFDGRRLPPKVIFKDMLRWDRHIVQFYSIHIPSTLLPLSKDECNRCKCPINHLRPVTVGTHRILDWLCVCCGKRYLCDCSMGLLESIIRRENFDNRSYITLHEVAQYREGICHLCRSMPSEIQFGSEINGGLIYQYYRPYIDQTAELHNVDLREAENLVRDRLGVPRIGEGWLSEMLVVNAVRYFFPDLTVEHQASPSWLGRQRFDAYIKEHRVAIEYNGEQHYAPVSIFGGELGFKAVQARDRRKLELSLENGVEVVIFSHEDELSDELIYQRVKEAIGRQIKRNGGS